MAADQAPGQAGKAQRGSTRLLRGVIQPGGMDINWDKVSAAGTIIGAVAVIHGVKTRRWRYIHRTATVLTIGAAAAARLKGRYAAAPKAPGDE